MDRNINASSRHKQKGKIIQGGDTGILFSFPELGLLKKNAEKLKVATIETAKESERGIVDMETLKMTNESLISTLDEVMRIQTEGREKRREAEHEMQRLEGELKTKLLQLHG